MKEKIKVIIGRVTENESMAAELSDNADIINDIGLDSLQMIDFMLQIEEEFNIVLEFDTLDISHMHSIEKLAEFLSSQKQVE